jgi:cobalt-zinc-cadmium efflux system protein
MSSHAHDPDHDHDHDDDHGHGPGAACTHDHGHDHDHDHAHDHAHGHAHGHAPGHVHAPADFGKAFFFGILLNSGFVVAEAVYGVLGNSLALLADAGHNLGDVLALGMAWGATVMSRRAPSLRYTYGLRGTSILAALTNAVLLLVVTGGIGWEAVVRLRDPGSVQGLTVIAVAAVGVFVNLGTALLFMSGRKGDLNVRAAFLHMAGDAAISLGVVIAGAVILFTGWTWLDPAVSLLVSGLVIWGTWDLLRHSLRLALQAVPAGIAPDAVLASLQAVEGVTEVHDLHIWAMSTTETALTAHLVCPGGYPGDAARQAICDMLKARFSIGHATLQVELGDTAHPCALAPADVV